MSVCFGLDVGHTSACLAVSKDGRVDVVANDAGDRCTPAVVAWNGDEVMVGASAAQYGARNPLQCVQRNQKLLALAANVNKFKDEIDEAVERSGAPNGPRIVVPSGTDRVLYHIDGGNGQATKKIPPSSVHSHIFKYMHEIAASHATDNVDAKNTVLTVPFGYDSAQREAVSKAAEAAGFHVVQVVSKPAAACMAYSLGQLDNTECQKCVVYRCGGHTLTVAVVQVNGGMVSVMECKNFAGVGGDRITEVLADYLAVEFQRKHRMDPRESKRSKLKLKLNAETVKRILSTLDTSNCYIESLCEGIDFSCNVTRARFENELSKVLPSLIDPIQETLAAAGVNAADIDKVILCGGTSKIPKLKKSISGLFSGKAEILSSLSPDEVLALGAASQASLLNEPWKPKAAMMGDQDQAAAADPTISPSLQATSGAIVFKTNLEGGDEIVLIPDKCPIPTRRSHHMTIPKDHPPVDKLTVKLFLKSAADQLTELGEMSLEGGLSEESKLSISCHIHRDGGVHFGLTDKHNEASKGDQLTFLPATS